MSRRLAPVLLGALCALLGHAPLAAAAPVTVDLRIEGKIRTLYEGKVTTDLRTVDLMDGTGPHACDGTANPATPVPGPTRGAAFMTAKEGPGGFTLMGTFTFDMGFIVIAGDSVAFDAATGEFLAEYKNGQLASFGSCGDQIATGDKVLYAYATGSEQLLELSGPATVAPGVPATFKVTDAVTAAAVAGATVAGQTTGADGSARVTLAAAGPATLKASRSGAIRSNGVAVCATTGSDGACGTVVPVVAPPAAPPPCATNGRDGRCGTRDLTAPSARVRGIAEGQRFARGKGPRELTVIAAGEPSGLHAVKLRLTRNDRGRCSTFSGKTERFRHVKCGAQNGFWFGIGDRAETSYLLPSRLPPGRYVLDVNAIDRSFNRDDTRRRGANRIVFHVG